MALHHFFEPFVRRFLIDDEGVTRPLWASAPRPNFPRGYFDVEMRGGLSHGMLAIGFVFAGEFVRRSLGFSVVMFPGFAGICFAVVGFGVLNGVLPAASRVRAKVQTRSGWKPVLDLLWIRSIVHERNSCPCCGESLLFSIERGDEGVSCPRCDAFWHLAAWGYEGPGYHRPNRPDRALPGSARPFLPNICRDSRGVQVPLAFAAASPGRAISSHMESWARVRLVRDAALVVGWIIGTALFHTTFGPMFSTRQDAIIATASAGGVLLLGFLGVRHGLRWGDAAQRYTEALFARGLCPCCEHELPDEASVFDGCTVCRACGSAWRGGEPA